METALIKEVKRNQKMNKKKTMMLIKHRIITKNKMNSKRIKEELGVINQELATPRKEIPSNPEERNIKKLWKILMYNLLIWLTITTHLMNR